MHRDGIRFQGLRFLDPTLAAYVGEAVTIHYDPRDLGEIRGPSFWMPSQRLIRRLRSRQLLSPVRHSSRIRFLAARG